MSLKGRAMAGNLRAEGADSTGSGGEPHTERTGQESTEMVGWTMGSGSSGGLVL